MSRYIDADEMKEYVNSKSTNWLNEWDTLGVLAAIDKQPTADVIEVKHGHWSGGTIVYYDENGMNFGYMCSVCEKCVKERSAYCGNCGAKMDEEVE